MDYPPNLIRNGCKATIFEVNKAIRIFNGKLGVSTPNVICSSLNIFCYQICFQPGKLLSKVVDNQLVPRPEAWTSDGYHVNKGYLPAYEKAMVKYLKGSLSD